jgi:hypothetical protein
MRRSAFTAGIAGLIVVLAACGSSTRGDVVVPTMASLDTLPTAAFLTANAPPSGYSVIQVNPIDRQLSERLGWGYTISGSFEGTFDDSGDAATGSLNAEVQANELGQTRRVVLSVGGTAFLPEGPTLKLEGVRWINDSYTVDVNGGCTLDTGDQRTGVYIADLSAGQIIGGVAQATPTGFQREIDGVPTWQYGFALGDVNVPALRSTADSAVALQADLWFSPYYNAVLHYEVTATVAHVRLLWANADTTSTVSGTLHLTYDLDVAAIDSQPNISIPNGC